MSAVPSPAGAPTARPPISTQARIIGGNGSNGNRGDQHLAGPPALTPDELLAAAQALRAQIRSSSMTLCQGHDHAEGVNTPLPCARAATRYLIFQDASGAIRRESYCDIHSPVYRNGTVWPRHLIKEESLDGSDSPADVQALMDLHTQYLKAIAHLAKQSGDPADSVRFLEACEYIVKNLLRRVDENRLSNVLELDDLRQEVRLKLFEVMREHDPYDRDISFGGTLWTESKRCLFIHIAKMRGSISVPSSTLRDINRATAAAGENATDDDIAKHGVKLITLQRAKMSMAHVRSLDASINANEADGTTLHSLVPAEFGTPRPIEDEALSSISYAEMCREIEAAFPVFKDNQQDMIGGAMLDGLPIKLAQVCGISGSSKAQQGFKHKLRELLAEHKPVRVKRYRGVCSYATSFGTRWHVFIRANGKRQHIGSFRRESDAARAADRTALKFRGDKAVLNFPRLRESYLAEVTV